ncbi:hypothetical protein ACERII_08225 [Evansella sp. AB-rgal1]|uniref:hypothetical protein n=1 Tax=Evansella sp. AB-rgal1 TaxID=3242696 RepID=UPI00359D587B
MISAVLLSLVPIFIAMLYELVQIMVGRGVYKDYIVSELVIILCGLFAVIIGFIESFQFTIPSQVLLLLFYSILIVSVIVVILVKKRELVVHNGSVDEFLEVFKRTLHEQNISYKLGKEGKTGSTIHYIIDDDTDVRIAWKSHFLNQDYQHTIQVQYSVGSIIEPFVPIMVDVLREKRMDRSFSRRVIVHGVALIFIGAVYSFLYHI